MSTYRSISVIWLFHDLGDHEEPLGVGDPANELEPLLAEALKRVWRGPGLEGSPSHDGGPRGANRRGRAHHLLLGLNGAGAGHEHHGRAADLDVPDSDNAVGLAERAAGKLERLRNPAGFGDAGHGAHLLQGRHAPLAHCGHYDRRRVGREHNLKSQLAKARLNRTPLLRSSVGP